MLSESDLELLSAYLDGALSESERAALEARLEADADLRRELERLRATVALVSSLPTLRAPRDFTLTPRMVRRPSVLTSAAFSALSAAAAVVLLVLGAMLFLPTLRPPAQEVANQIAFAPTGTGENGSALRQRTETALELETGADAEAETFAEAGTPLPPAMGMVAETLPPADEPQLEMAIVPSESPEALMFAVPQGTLVQDTFSPETADAPPDDALADLAAEAMPAPIEQSLPEQAETLDTARAMQADETSGAGSAAMSSASEAEAPSVLEFAPAGTSAPAPQASVATEIASAALALEAQEEAATEELVTPSATASPTETATASPTATATATLIPTPTPTPEPSIVETPDAPGLAVVLFAGALVLLGLAVVTTIMRRRA